MRLAVLIHATLQIIFRICATVPRHKVIFFQALHVSAHQHAALAVVIQREAALLWRLGRGALAFRQVHTANVVDA